MRKSTPILAKIKYRKSQELPLTPLLTASLALRLSRALEPTALLGSKTLRVSLPARLAAQQPAFGISIFLVLSPVAYYLIARYSYFMHVISRKTLRQFWAQHPDSEHALARWFKIMQRHDFTNFEALRATFPTTDKVGDFIVLNIGGNKYRLITAIHFNRRKVYIRHLLTHQEYDRGAWKP